MKKKNLIPLIVVIIITAILLISLITYNQIKDKEYFYEIGIVSGVLFAEIIFTILKSTGFAKKTEYDERQMLLRGRCYKLAWVSSCVSILVLCIISEVFNIKWEDFYTPVLISILASLLVFVIYAIILDAYEGITGSSKQLYAVFVLLGVLYLGLGVYDGSKGELYTNKVIMSDSLELALGVLFLITGIVGMAKKIIDKKREVLENEEPQA